MPNPSSLTRKTAVGAMWAIATGIGARAAGLVGTLLITRYIAPDVLGNVNAAQIAAYTAYFASSLGVGGYIVSQQDADRQTIFNATVLYMSACVVAVGVVYLLREPIAAYLDAPAMVRYIPGIVVAVLIERLTYIPDRLMIRDMRFKDVGIRNTIGELTYTVSSVGLAVLGWGGNAVVAGMLLRTLVRLVITVPAVPLRDWLTPSPLSREKIGRILRFGLPLNLASLANFGAQRWDNLVMIRLFGPGTGGLYNLAWNLADIPASQVGERIGDVLVPSFAKLEPSRRKDALIRAITMLSLLIFPLAVGLGAVGPTIFRDTLFTVEWQAAGPYLMVLSALGVTRPIGWVISAYLQVYGRTRSIMVLEWLKVLAIVGGVAALGAFGGPIVACAGVGVAFGLHAAASMALARRVSDVPYLALIRPLIRPLLACAPMVVAILAVRYGLDRFEHLPRGTRLGAEVIAGGIAFVLCALVIAPRASREFLDLGRNALRRKK
jgi:PST family polysaccharide transporter